MDKQVEKQFEQFQDGFKSFFEAGQKMMAPAFQGGEVAIESLHKAAEDQIQFGRSCLDISRKQAESLKSAKDATEAFRGTEAWSDFYSAATTYGEALRKNAEQTRDRLLKVGREATETVVSEASKVAGKATAKV